MAIDEHVRMLCEDPSAWQEWCQRMDESDPSFTPDLTGTDALSGRTFQGVNLWMADLSGADLARTTFRECGLASVRMGGANLRGANLTLSNLWGAKLNDADLTDAKRNRAQMTAVEARGATFVRAHLFEAMLRDADLTGADLTDANLGRSTFVGTKLDGATLDGCRVYGMSAWDVGTPKSQTGLVITKENDPEITVDDLRMAQFVYLMIENENVRDVIDTLATKVVLILGCFAEPHKRVLDAVREELREHDLVPIVFDFEQPSSRAILQTVQILARISRFVIADMTGLRTVAAELATMVPSVMVPFVPLQHEAVGQEWSVARSDLPMYDWFLPTVTYDNAEQLVQDLSSCVIEPALSKGRELRDRLARQATSGETD